ncbi:Outer membrane protein beta-barrel domain-containing protein [Maribacter dokdonensis]|uniref:outer membrane beta-barrel protein n=1 Tax=Maribacter dokdonensis TaxID=320912 RepID=UPI001B0B7881|nr:outer membrane beta-barrel protein [Maribacter dokdonensis]CAG2532813.1 Outer membrane protein beta-barrel domain-containing protein [Maribacter dokdonensis]
MKKSALIIILLIPILVSSQKKFGAVIGLNNSSISEGFLSEIYITDKFGFHIGAFYEMELNEKVIFRPKLMYSQQGNRDNYRNFNTEILNYVNVPLDLKFFDSTYLLVGPQIGFLVSDNDSVFTSGPKSTFDMGIKLGIGQQINNFVLELNLYQGLTKAVENFDFDKGTNTVIQFSVGYYIF